MGWVVEGGWADSRKARSSGLVVESDDSGEGVFSEGGWTVDGTLVEVHSQPILGFWWL